MTSMGTKVHTTFQPDEPIEVEDQELLDLQRQGLIVSGKGDINDKGEVKKTAAAKKED